MEAKRKVFEYNYMDSMHAQFWTDHLGFSTQILKCIQSSILNVLGVV